MEISLEKGFISADSHVVEPPDLWQTRMEKRFRDRAPHYESFPEGDYFCVDGVIPFPATGFLGAWATEKMAGEGQVTSLFRRKEEIRPGGWDPQARLADMELDHVRAEVLYPGTALLFFAIPDPEYQRDCMRVYNDWLSEFCAVDPKRFVGAALLPTRGPIEWALQEAERTAKLGLRSVMIPCGFPEQHPYQDQYYEPLWAALQDMQLPIALHPGGSENAVGDTFGRAIPINAWVIENKIVPMERTVAGLLASAVPQKYPKLQFVIVEGGIGWIAAVLRFMDHWWEDHRQWIEPKLDHKPSFYFHRQCWATFEDDRAGLLTRELLNVDHLMWGSDYPHTEGTFPRSRQQIAHDFAGVPEAELRKIVAENAARLYGIA